MGLWNTDMFYVFYFLSVEYRFHSASLTFPEFQRVDSNNCQSGKGGDTETEEKQLNGGTPLRQIPVPTQRNMHNNVSEFFYRSGAPTQVEDGNFKLNTRFLEHSSICFTTNQSKKKSDKPCSPHPKCCLLFLGTSDDHPIRSVWPLSSSSLRGANCFKLKCYYYKGECWFQSRPKIYLDLDQVERDFHSARQAYSHAQ